MQLPNVDEIRAWAAAVGADAAPLLAMYGKAARNTGRSATGSRAPTAQQYSRTRCADWRRSAPRCSPSTSPRSCQPCCGPPPSCGKSQRRGIPRRQRHHPRQPRTAHRLEDAAPVRPVRGGCQVVHVIGEAVLRTRVGDVTVGKMRGQLAHLAETATLPATNSPSSSSPQPRPSPPPPGSSCTTTTSPSWKHSPERLDITDPTMIARYTRSLEQLRQAAITGTTAAEQCRRTANELS